MIDYTDRILEKLRSVAPIESISIGSFQDKSSWKVFFSAEATQAQRTQAQLAIDNFNLDEPSSEDIKEEANRRMRVLLGARDRLHLAEVIQRGNREAIALLKKGADNWTAQEQARATELENLDLMLNAIAQASNSLEALANRPTDYTNNTYWP